MIVLLGAVREEIAGVRRHMAVETSIRGRGWRRYEGRYAGKEVVLVQTGMGRTNAEDRARRVLDDYAVTALIAFGFAGALCPRLGVGDVVLCRELYCETEPTGAAACHSDSRLLSLAAGALQHGTIHLRALPGGSVTVSRLVTDPERKKALSSRFGAKAVDMESYWLARLADANQISFLAVHAISDTVDERLPPFDRFVGAHGEWLWRKALLHFVHNPGDLVVLARLYGNSRQAAASLTGFLDVVIPEL